VTRAWRWALAAASVVVLAGCGSPNGRPRPATSLSAPLAAASEFLRLDRSGAQITSLVVRRPGEGGHLATVIATLDRLPDDSVRAIRYVLTFERRGNRAWHLRSAVRTQRCWPHRGHQGFSPADCV
jgi:hypothetical protein